MLIPFPIAFCTGTLVADIVGVTNGNASWTIMASRLAIAGIMMALVAATPGLIDYFSAVPPKSTGKSRATKHMLLNISIILLFFIASQFRTSETMMPGRITIVLEAIGFGLLIIAGWMGGTLAYRNQIGVDHRYANAGKWNSTIINTKEGSEVEVAGVDELEVNQMKLLEVAGKRIVTRHSVDHASVGIQGTVGDTRETLWGCFTGKDFESSSGRALAGCLAYLRNRVPQLLHERR